MVRLPIFPLGTVLFPCAGLPLRVFEPRYVRLIEELMDQPAEERFFGVVALRHGNEVGTDHRPMLARTGTTAMITGIRSDVGGPHGRVFSIETVGVDRFEVVDFDDDTTEYYTADITWLEDPDVDEDEMARLGELASQALDDFLSAVTGSSYPMALVPDGLAYEIMHLVPLPIEDRQAVLDADDPLERLRLATAFLTRERLLYGQFRLAPVQRYNLAAPGRN
ncbi:MAG: LON peptidase substrate-binding domain-containing protein [Actinomycetia bacterium]|nr:LON peptidase substrate-binding domain-containing protein [Actinomycetes bacterium]